MEATTTDRRVSELRAWILDRHPEHEDLGPDTDLLEEVLADSLELIALIMFVEELRGTPIAVQEVDKESFRTLGQIREKFLSAGTQA